MKAIGIRFAKAVNRVLGRTGRVFRDRYHHQVLKTPTQVRNALKYVLLNARRHAKRLTGAARLDPCSSARWFDGWKRGSRRLEHEARGRPGGGVFAIALPHTWLLQEGWRRAGPALDPAAVPGR